MQNPFEIVIHNQGEDEKILKVWRHHPITLVPVILRIMAFVAIPLLLLFLTGLSMFGSVWLFGMFLVIVAIVLTYAAHEWVSWYNDAYILTSERIVDVAQDGFFHRRFSEATLDNIQDIKYEYEGFLQTMFDYGDVEVATAGPIENIKMWSIRDPQQQAIYLLKEREKYMEEQGQDDSLSAEELIQLLTKHRKDLDQLAKQEKEDMVKKGQEQIEKIKQERAGRHKHKRTGKGE